MVLEGEVELLSLKGFQIRVECSFGKLGALECLYSSYLMNPAA